MNVNTTTGKLKLTKTERACLDKAAKIVGNIAKHADGPTQARAEAAEEQIDSMPAAHSPPMGKGVCLPPTKAADLRERFTIPAGTPVQLQPVANCRAELIDYTTKSELQFRKCEDFTKGYGKFRETGWFIFVRWGRVVRRE